MKKILFFAVIAIMIASCANKKEKELKLYNPTADSAKIAVSTVYSNKIVEGDVVIYKFNNISSALIENNNIRLLKQSYAYTQTGREYEILLATGYDSLQVEFSSPFDENEYKKGGKSFGAPYKITLWGTEKTVIINVER